MNGSDTRCDEREQQLRSSALPRRMPTAVPIPGAVWGLVPTYRCAHTLRGGAIEVSQLIELLAQRGVITAQERAMLQQGKIAPAFACENRGNTARLSTQCYQQRRLNAKRT